MPGGTQITSSYSRRLLYTGKKKKRTFQEEDMTNFHAPNFMNQVPLNMMQQINASTFI